jgi:formiminotetrahydrofolate cyclodeaminase
MGEGLGVRSLSGYIEEVASANPTPGGGSVAAIVGALAAALGEMVVNLSLGRDPDPNVEQTLQTAGQRLEELRATLSAAAVVDERAYAGYRAASSMPRGCAAEKMVRVAAMQAALREATEAPLAVARAATETAEIMEDVASLGNPHLRSDAALGALLAEAALRGALLNVRGNAALLKDKARAAAYLVDANLLEEGGRAAAARAYRLAIGERPEDDFR